MPEAKFPPRGAMSTPHPALQQISFAAASRWLGPTALMNECDTNGDGQLDLHDFAEALKALRLQLPSQVILDAWEYMDKDSTGLVSTSDIAAALSIDGESLVRQSHPELLNSTTRQLEESMAEGKRFIALIAHNDMKPAMMTFVAKHIGFFRKQRLVTTGSAGRSLEMKLGLWIGRKVANGPIGGDQDIGGMISRGEVGAVFFFRDPLTAHPHTADASAFLRLCDVHDVATATSPASAEAMVHAFQTSEQQAARLHIRPPCEEEATSVLVHKYMERKKQDSKAR